MLNGNRAGRFVWAWTGKMPSGRRFTVCLTTNRLMVTASTIRPGPYFRCSRSPGYLLAWAPQSSSSVDLLVCLHLPQAKEKAPRHRGAHPEYGSRGRVSKWQCRFSSDPGIYHAALAGAVFCTDETAAKFWGSSLLAVEAWQKGRAAATEPGTSPVAFLKRDWPSQWAVIQRHCRPLFLTFAPVTAAYLISFLIWGFWPLYYENRTADPFNDSLWPHGLFIGIVILYRAIKTKDFRLAMIASPFLSPCVTNHGWAVALLGLGNLETIIVSIGIWIFRFLFRNI